MKNAFDCLSIQKSREPQPVSYTHLDPWYAHKLDPILRERSWKLSGILNGIDVVNYDPEHDPNLYAN